MTMTMTTSFHFGLCGRKFVLCLFGQVSAPYVIAGSTQGLHTCLFGQMARLLLKISRCLAYAAREFFFQRVPTRSLSSLVG